MMKISIFIIQFTLFFKFILGSSLANRSYASLIAFLRSNELDGLYLMDQFNDNNERQQSHVISSKYVSKFMEVISSLNELTLNSNHLGNSWMTRLCEILESNTAIKYIR